MYLKRLSELHLPRFEIGVFLLLDILPDRSPFIPSGEQMDQVYSKAPGTHMGLVNEELNIKVQLIEMYTNK